MPKGCSLHTWATSGCCCWVSLARSQDQPRAAVITQQLFQSLSGLECRVLAQIGLTQMLFVCYQIKATPNSSGCEKWKQKRKEWKKTPCVALLCLSLRRDWLLCEETYWLLAVFFSTQGPPGPKGAKGSSVSIDIVKWRGWGALIKCVACCDYSTSVALRQLANDDCSKCSLFRLSKPRNYNWGRFLLHTLYFIEHQCSRDHKEESSAQSLGENLLL